MNKRFLDFDWNLIAPIVILVTLSLATLFSINFNLFKSQLFFVIIAIFALFFFSRVNYKIIENYSLPLYILSIVLLLLVLIVGIESRGSVRWLEIFGFRIQFSELLKPFLAISLSSYLSKHENYSLKVFFLTICFMLPVTFLIYIQPDLGDALIYVIVAVMTLIVFGFPLRLFFGGLVLIGIAFPILWRFMHDYQKQRILTFLHPTDPLGFSYNSIQSIIAIGSGMVTGRGLGLGSQSGLQFLPERHTDFIFATLSEGLGFVGAVVVILSFTYLLYRIFLIFSNTDDLFCKLFAGIAFFLILSQFFINVGMNIGILPIVGVTLPFVSYGGSSLVSNFILVGLLLAISKNSATDKVLEIK